jgi:crotonobetainyl-CoA:carnitine CoA-transferase CaiB-like acyl-CoA transferase
VYRMDEVFADPQIAHLGMAAPVEHPALGRLDLVRNAVRMTGVGPTVRSASPDAGDHTDPVLAELGYGDDDIDRLRTTGVVGGS